MKQQGVFGLFRYGLAMLVVVGHLWSQLAPKAGTYAVFSFYMLSGYLMTYVIREVYGLSFSGMKRFLLNRFLRIYPLYWLVMVMTIVLLLWVGSFSEGFIDPAVKIPSDFIHWLANIIIFGLASGVNTFHMSGERLVSVGWSLHIELCFYVLMVVVLVRRDWIILLWFIMSMFYTTWMVVQNYSWQDRYFTLAAASLPFSMGSGIYLLLKHKITIFNDNKILLIFPIVFMVHALSNRILYGGVSGSMGLGFYISLILSFFALQSLLSMNFDGSKLSVWDRFFANLSYPLFLTHVIIGMMLSYVMSVDKGLVLFVSTLGVATFISIFLHQFIEKKVESIRRVVRSSQV